MATIDSSESTTPTSEWAETDPEAFDDYYDDEATRRPVRKPLNFFTLVLCALVIAGAAFYGGVLTEKGRVKSSSSSGTASLAAAARFRGAASGTGGGTGGGSAAGGAVSGTITLIDGANVYVTDSSGNIVKVVTTPASQITVTGTGTVQKLHPGDNVVVIGPADADGNVTASTLRDTGTGTAGGGRAGRNGGTSSGSGTAGAGSAVPALGGAPAGG